MKKGVFALVILFAFSCSKNDDSTSEDSSGRDFRQDMRNYVIGISKTAKAINPNFVVIPQNGVELVTANGEEGGVPATEYLNAIDGNGQEDLFFGYDKDDTATPASDNKYLQSFLKVAKDAGKTILVTDYCSTPSKIEQSYQKNSAAGYISYAATHRDLDVIPANVPNNVNSDNITSLKQAKNFLFLINPESYTSKSAFINAVTATNYDVLIMDLFLNNESFTAAEVAKLRNKANGGRRMVICYISIGEAEDYRYYWQSGWSNNKPDWIAKENPNWPGNYKVKYWNDDWQSIIYKNSDSYLSKITAAGFDGVYLDIIDAFEYFE
jgi:cysteinyl-tRNA synthetase